MVAIGPILSYWGYSTGEALDLLKQTVPGIHILSGSTIFPRDLSFSSSLEELRLTFITLL